MPTDSNVFSILNMLFGENLTVSSTEALSFDGTYAAIYVNDQDQPVTACLCDPAFAAYSSSAMTLLPPNVAEEAAKANNLTEIMLSSLTEIMNICSRLFMSDTSPHLRLIEVCRAQDAAVLSALQESGSATGFQIAIPRYGTGVMSVLVT